MEGWRECLEQLKTLPVGWDGNQAKPIEQGVVDMAEKLLGAIFKENSVRELGFVPGADGSVMIELCIRGFDIKIGINYRTP